MDGSGQEIHRSKQDRLRALRETHRLRKLQWMGFAEFFIGPTAGRTRWVYSGQAYVSQAYVSIELSGLGGALRAGRFHRPHIHVEQGVALVALLLVLLPQFDDFLEDFHIEALGLGL